MKSPATATNMKNVYTLNRAGFLQISRAKDALRRLEDNR